MIQVVSGTCYLLEYIYFVRAYILEGSIMFQHVSTMKEALLVKLLLDVLNCTHNTTLLLLKFTFT